MNANDIMPQFRRDFSFSERQKLANPRATVQEMTRGDRVKVNVEMLEYLRDFQKAIYHGEPIPKVFQKALIEVTGLKDGSVRRLFVTFPESKPNWVYMDLFVGWTHVAKLFYYNVQLAEEDKFEDGRYFVYTPAITKSNMNLPEIFLKQLVSEARDIFTYTFLYVWANRENQEIFKEEEIPDRNAKKGKSSKKRHKKPDAKAKTRDTVHVPTRRIYTVKTVEIPKQPSKTHQREERNYHLTEWPVRGYTRKHVRKDGMVVEIPVRPHSRRRRKGNPEGLVKDPGKDYILHERPIK